jgi:hypothetical protein
VNQEQESLWRVALRAAVRTWRRDLLAIPVVWLLTGFGMTALYGRRWLNDWDTLLPGILIGCLAWPVALWLLDRILGRYHTSS